MEYREHEGGGGWRREGRGGPGEAARLLDVEARSSATGAARASLRRSDQEMMTLDKILVVGTLCAVGAALYAVSPSIKTGDYCNPDPEEMPRLQLQINDALAPDDWKPFPGCPGSDDFEPGIANIRLGSTTFAVPRSEIAYGPSLSDGPARAIGVKLRSSDYKSVTIIIKRSSNVQSSCYEEECDAYFSNLFRSTTRPQLYQRPAAVTATPDNFVETPPIEGIRVLVRPSEESAREWIICTSSVCTAHAFYRQFGVYLSFPPKLQYESLKRAIVTQIESYCNCTPTPIP